MSAAAAARRLRFTKMHGIGNDFVVLDWRDEPAPLSPPLAARLGDRHRGVGCDQLLTIEPARSAQAAFAYGIWNRDGSRAGQCGNGARCVAAWARRAGLVGEAPFVMDSPAGPVQAAFHGDDVEVSLGVPDFSPAAVPFRGDAGGGAIDVAGAHWTFDVVSLGNPHAVIAVDDVHTAPVTVVGPALQADPRFPDACNVGFVQRVAVDRLRLRVFERGVGETLACGSAACAAVAVLHRAGRIDREATVELPGGALHIAWDDLAAPMRMRGAAEFVFEGELLS